MSYADMLIISATHITDPSLLSIRYLSKFLEIQTVILKLKFKYKYGVGHLLKSKNSPKLTKTY